MLRMLDNWCLGYAVSAQDSNLLQNSTHFTSPSLRLNDASNFLVLCDLGACSSLAGFSIAVVNLSSLLDLIGESERVCVRSRPLGLLRSLLWLRSLERLRFLERLRSLLPKVSVDLDRCLDDRLVTSIDCPLAFHAAKLIILAKTNNV